jgi:hypothetical protein
VNLDDYELQGDVENIRDVIGNFIGRTVIDITQPDEDEMLEGEDPYIMFMFDDGSTLKMEVVGLEAFNSETGEQTAIYLTDYLEDDDDDLDDMEIN